MSVTVTPQTGLTAEAPKFPKPEDFFFGPTAENLKVYTKPFVVTVSMKVDGAAAGTSARDVTLAGAVRYQACDDRVCFPPQSAPFEARVALAGERR